MNMTFVAWGFLDERHPDTLACELSETCRIELGNIFEEAGVENMDVARLGTPEGVAKLRKFLNAIRKMERR